MAKRRLSRQQQRRISAGQRAEAGRDDSLHGRIVSHQGKRVLIEIAPARVGEARIRANLGTLVCGDRVAVEMTAGGELRVVAVLPRDNLLQRVDGYGQARAVAANLSRLFVCLAVAPEPNLLLLDEYLLSAEQQAIDAQILLNKIDLAPGVDDPFELRRIYAPLGYPVLHTSVRSGAGMADFERSLPGQVSVLSGVSGVGKSSLTQYLLPDEEIKIAELSAHADEGRHTTRASRLYHLPKGGDLIDTPGVRGFSPFVDAERSPAQGFREIHARATGCRFNDCRHANEPGCAVIAAVEDGTIAASRYRNYLKLLERPATPG